MIVCDWHTQYKVHSKLYPKVRCYSRNIELIVYSQSEFISWTWRVIVIKSWWKKVSSKVENKLRSWFFAKKIPKQMTLGSCYTACDIERFLWIHKSRMCWRPRSRSSKTKLKRIDSLASLAKRDRVTNKLTYCDTNWGTIRPEPEQDMEAVPDDLASQLYAAIAAEAAEGISSISDSECNAHLISFQYLQKIVHSSTTLRFLRWVSLVRVFVVLGGREGR